jgi:hypothetical protein
MANRSQERHGRWSTCCSMLVSLVGDATLKLKACWELTLRHLVAQALAGHTIIPMIGTIT